MKTSLDCLPCLVRQALDSSRLIFKKDEDKVKKLMEIVFTELSLISLDKTPPETASIIHRTIKKLSGASDPYKELKDISTTRAFEISENILFPKAAGKRFEAALRYAIAGNIIDFGMKSDWDENFISESFKQAETKYIDKVRIDELYNKISEAELILYLADNAGETVFDRYFIESFPGSSRVVYVVKSKPVINDAVYEDAKKAGLDKEIKIIGNGSDVPGTILKMCSDEFKDYYLNADLIIAKGQANFETLSEAMENIFLLFQVKCDAIANRYNLKKGSWQVLKSGETECR